MRCAHEKKKRSRLDLIKTYVCHIRCHSDKMNEGNEEKVCKSIAKTLDTNLSERYKGLKERTKEEKEESEIKKQNILKQN